MQKYKETHCLEKINFKKSSQLSKINVNYFSKLKNCYSASRFELQTKYILRCKRFHTFVGNIYVKSRRPLQMCRFDIHFKEQIVLFILIKSVNLRKEQAFCLVNLLVEGLRKIHLSVRKGEKS